MKVKIIKNCKIRGLWIRKNEVLKVRLIGRFPLDLSPQIQIIEGTHSGEFIPREIFVEIPEEKTYTEKEWNNLENHYMKELDEERGKNENLQLETKRLENEVDAAKKNEMAVLPLEVYEVFTRVDKAWNALLGKESTHLLYLSIVSLRVEGDALVLKKFAMDNPTTYMQAVLNGYTLADEDVDKAEIRRWYKGALIREADKTDPDGFAK